MKFVECYCYFVLLSFFFKYLVGSFDDLYLFYLYLIYLKFLFFLILG